MSKPPDWLPPLVSVGGEWQQVLARLYAIFDTDFKQTLRSFQGQPVWWDRRILAGESYEEGFWHLITKIDPARSERLLDPRRAERLPWCAPTICNAGDQIVKVWDFKEANGRIRTYLWLEALDYVIILEKRRQRSGIVAFLITAFYVEGESKRRNLRAKHEERIV